jgi:hypothetical protein
MYKYSFPAVCEEKDGTVIKRRLISLILDINIKVEAES